MGSDARGRTLLDARTYGFIVSGVLTVLLVSIVSMLPLPYALESPGPVRNVLAGTGDDQLIQIEGHRTYETSGALDLLTVQVNGGPGESATIWSVLDAALDPDVDIHPVTEIYPPDQTREEATEQNAADMADSQTAATAAALRTLGIGVTEKVFVKSVSEETHAVGHLQDGDRILSVAGVPVSGLTQMQTQLAAMPGDTPVAVVVSRDGKQVTENFPTTAREDTATHQVRTVLGFTPRQDFTFPFTVKISLNNIGGPSAGMMFALGIIDKLTPGEMTGGRQIAGTGALEADGRIAAIGGIRQKMLAAKAAGATWFLAPKDNCTEVVGEIPSGLRVISVDTLANARTAVETIAAEDQSAIDALPQCTG